jgi:hypothetical protein
MREELHAEKGQVFSFFRFLQVKILPLESNFPSEKNSSKKDEKILRIGYIEYVLSCYLAFLCLRLSVSIGYT